MFTKNDGNIVFKYNSFNDVIKIAYVTIYATMFIIQGKEGNYFARKAPGLKISGYGRSEAEAEDYFNEELNLFCKDLLALGNEERIEYIRELGFKYDEPQDQTENKLKGYETSIQDFYIYDHRKKEIGKI